MIDEGVDHCSDECHNYWRERAERAEAEVADVRKWKDLATKWALDPAEGGRAIAALARVRALIDARPLYGTAYTLSEQIRAAIEGDNQ